jgi:hypothetical protein
MQRVRLIAFALITLVTALGASIARADTPATQPSAATGAAKSPSILDVVAPYVGGEWKINAIWSGGNALQAREVFTWGPGKKFVICKTFVSTPQGEYERYETIFGEQDGKLMTWAFTVDGEVNIVPFAVEGKKLSSSRPIQTADGKDGGTLHQSVEQTSPNQFRWLVSIEKDGKTNQIMDGTWIRDAVGTAK